MFIVNRMIIKTKTNEWEIISNIFGDIKLNDSIYLDIKDKIFVDILSKNTNLDIKELIETYKIIDYLQLNEYMRPFAKKIAKYMNNCSKDELIEVLEEFHLL